MRLRTPRASHPPKDENLRVIHWWRRHFRLKYNDTLPPASYFETTYGPVPIDSLYGLLQHPFSDDVGDLSYLVLLSNGTHPKLFADVFPGRAILMDCGAGATFSSSMQYFFEKYGSNGIHFDEAYGWDVLPGASSFMSTVPAHLQSIVRFAHRLITDAPEHQDNSVHFITQLYRPGDFIVFKLGVDAATTGVHGALPSPLPSGAYRALCARCARAVRKVGCSPPPGVR